MPKFGENIDKVEIPGVTKKYWCDEKNIGVTKKIFGMTKKILV
jgi:hypothetical protein